MNKLPSAVEKVSPFRVMSVMERALQLEKAGRKIVHMEVGEPDFCTVAPIIEAGKSALDAGRTHYTSAKGLEELRSKISQFYAARNGVNVDPGRILITPGASGGLSLLANMLVGAGDGVLLTDPAYPCVRNFIHLMNAQPQLMPVTMANNFQPSLADYEKHVQANTTGLWLASPSNPTGTIMEREGLVEASQWAGERQLHLLVDEIYHGLHYVDDMPSILEVDESAFVVNSFSKYFGMTGWRLGWIVVPDDYIETATKLAQNLYISASSIAQYAALAAFTDEAETLFEQRRQAFKQRRDFLAAALREMGFKIPEKIQGAFYIYADISAFSDSAEEFCRGLIEDQGVAITPGADFGHFLCDRYVRIAFTTSMADLELGVERLRSALVK